MTLFTRGGARTSLVYFADGAQPEVLDVLPGDGYLNEIKYFADCVENGKAVDVILPEESVEVVDIIIAIKKSLKTGELVNVPE